MKKLDFLIGKWELKYRVPKSAFSEAQGGTGSGAFKRALNDRFVYFDYECHLPSGDALAHAVFTWDEKAKVFRYWWFEDSGSFLTATGNMIREGTLYLNWHDSLLTQTFKKAGTNRAILRMAHPDSAGKPRTILEVLFTRR
jgi:hypothetical protein